jgi:hypothetical protein
MRIRARIGTYAVGLTIVACSSIPQAWAGEGDVHFRYENPPTATTFDRIDAGDNVVVGPQGSDAGDLAAVAAIHAKGAVAYRYVQWYWAPEGRVYQAYDVADHLDWALCNAARPLKDTIVHPGETWVYLDTNERAARNAQVGFMRHLRDDFGYDGVFVDRGAAALTGVYATTISTCTKDPVVRGRTVARAYAGLVTQANALGLDVYLNTGPLAAVRTSPALSLIQLSMDENAAKAGVLRLRSNAAIGASHGIISTTLVRPGVTQAAQLANAALVPAVSVVAGVRESEENRVRS